MFAPERKEDPTTSTRKHLVLQQSEEVKALGYEVVTSALQDKDENRSSNDSIWIFGFDMEAIGVMNDIIDTILFFRVSLFACFIHSTVYVK